MTLPVLEGEAPAQVPSGQWPAARARFPARTSAVEWPATWLSREDVLSMLSQPRFGLEPSRWGRRIRGVRLLLTWLEDHPGHSWQQRWLSSGADTAGPAWRNDTAQWLHQRGERAKDRHRTLSAALTAMICADLIRPSMTWFFSGAASNIHLVAAMTQARDPDGFTHLRELCDRQLGASAATVGPTLLRSAVIIAVKGGAIADITMGDVLEVLDVEKNDRGKRLAGTTVVYRMLHQACAFGDQVPATLRELLTLGPRTPAQLIDQYRITCRPIRDLLVDYLQERQPALDYSTMEGVACYLGKLFWADIEQHHPGADSLHLPVDVVQGWKHRLQTIEKTVTTSTGDKAKGTVPRINYRDCLNAVRAFYLDLAHWAAEEPTRWGPWAVPCPISADEINRSKHKRHRKSRMDARTRERLPVLPTLTHTVDQQRKDTAGRLQAARQTTPGQTFTTAGQTLIRSTTRRSNAKIWAEDPATGKRRDLVLEESHAFWTWAAVEVLRNTGIRVEELLELSHHSLVQYRLPTTGEIVPLLQIAPSKTDAERLLLISPELADVLSTIICRIREPSGTIPLVPLYDRHERTWLTPAPLLFQRRIYSETRALNDYGIRRLLNTALTQTDLTDPTTDGPLHFTPHDFRRLFITDAILNGLPPHIAQIIAGHRDINVTMGYKAVYPEQTIQAHLAFLARRRKLRPTEEYRVPTDEEWAEFLGHFERRKVSIGTCGRASGTPCIHEHACIRCPLLWPHPAQLNRLIEIRDNLTTRITEAQREGWLGEIEGLQISLTGANEKIAQINRQPHHHTTTNLGLPTTKSQ